MDQFLGFTMVGIPTLLYVILKLYAASLPKTESFNGLRDDEYGDPLLSEMLEVLTKDKWKFVRNIAMPVMSNAARIRNAHPAMTESIKIFVTSIKKEIADNGKNGKLEKYAINEGISEMLTDLVARSQFSVNIGKSDSSNRFVQIVREVMQVPASDAPWIASYAYFLDTLLEWHNSLNTPDYIKHNVTENTIWALGLTMFLAGQDQLSLIIGSLMYSLACNPNMQKKAEDEVDKVFSKSTQSGTFTHESLSELTYVTACVTEVSRLYPFVYRTERVCTKDWEDTSGKGLKIKNGQLAVIAIWAANRNPEYYEDPEEFKPERFMPGHREKLHSYAFTSFGFGPRSCPGKRLSMEIMVLITAYILKEFRFVKRNDSQLTFLPGGPLFATSEPIYLDVELRNRREE